MTVQGKPFRLGLAQRAMALVAIALLPLGIISIWQADQIIQDQRETAERALLAVTEDAAARERRIIERAIGAAAAMGNTARSLRENPELCRSVLTSFERGSALYSYLGFTPADGTSGCHTATVPEDSQTGDRFAALRDQEHLGLYVKRNPEAPEDSVLVVATPAFENGSYVGHLRLHAPHERFETTEETNKDRPLGLVTFNTQGDILTSERVLAAARGLLPSDMALTDLINDEPYTFVATSENGVQRGYAFVTLVPGAAYALGTWNTSTELLQPTAAYWRTILLAVLTWLTSLLVVFLIMQLLVIRGVSKLTLQVRRFRNDRTVPSGPVASKGELYELEQDFRGMTETIIRDEAQLEDAVHEKNVLLKEVHHRVKNNLQLINSIINMILRGARSDETRVVVKRLQERVMALASVHRSIYQAQSMDRVDASEIIREIVNQGVAIGLPRGTDVEVSLDLAPVSLYPDQAMPLSLLVSEAVTNALKYVGGEEAYIAVTLSAHTGTATTADTATLTVANTVSSAINDAESTGLGSQLLQAFSHQLEGKVETTIDDGLYTFRITFAIAQFDPEETTLPAAAE